MVRVETEAGLFVADGAIGLAILVLATLVAQLEVKGQYKLFIWVQVDFVLNIFLVEERFCPTFGALETLRTLPVAFWDLDKLGFQAPEVSDFVTDRADEKALPLLT